MRKCHLDMINGLHILKTGQFLNYVTSHRILSSVMSTSSSLFQYSLPVERWYNFDEYSTLPRLSESHFCHWHNVQWNLAGCLPDSELYCFSRGRKLLDRSFPKRKFESDLLFCFSKQFLLIFIASAMLPFPNFPTFSIVTPMEFISCSGLQVGMLPLGLFHHHFFLGC